jgi:predicted transcriptional regulator
MQRLTPAEEQLMLRLWGLQEATVQDLIQLYPQPKPAYNTTSTIVRILEKKKFVRHKKKGRGFVYLPKITKQEYRDFLAEWMLNNYFDCSRAEAVSYFSQSKDLERLLI